MKVNGWVSGSRVEPFAALTTGPIKQKQEETKVSCLCEEDDTLRVLKEKFVAVAGADNVIDKDEFVHCFGLKDVSIYRVVMLTLRGG